MKRSEVLAATILGLISLLILFIATGGTATGAPTEWEQVQARCQPPSAAEPLLYQDDFRWSYTRQEMAERFAEIYASGKRLDRRAYWDAASGRFVLPYDKSRGGDITLPVRLIESVRSHIERALRLKYVDFVFFPDMGHTHLFIEQADWERVYKAYPVAQFKDMYDALFADPKLKLLYHTAEQLQTLDENNELIQDKETQWRYYTRNPVGENRINGAIEILRNFQSHANTVHDYEGHQYYGAGFSLSASKDGCFPFTVNGQTLYFDISMFDLPGRASGSGF